MFRAPVSLCSLTGSIFVPLFHIKVLPRLGGHPICPGPYAPAYPDVTPLGGGVKCAQIEDTSYGLTPSPAEADTCTSSSVGLIGGPWLCPVSLLCRWCDRAAIGACFPIRVSELICGTWCQGLSMWDAPSGSHFHRTSVCNSMFVLDSLELKDIEYNDFCPVDSEPVRVSSSCDIGSASFKSSQVELYSHSATCVDIQWTCNKMLCLTGPRCNMNTDKQQSE